MGVSSTTVGLVCSGIVLVFTAVVYHLFFRVHEKLENADKSSGGDQQLKKKKKSCSQATNKESILRKKAKSFNAKAALSHATDRKDHRLFWKELGGHVVSVTCVAFSQPKHDLIASGSEDGMVRCVMLSDLGKPSPPELQINIESCPDAMCFTQNSKRLIIASSGMVLFYSIQFNQHSRKIEFVKSFPSELDEVHTIQVLDVEQWMVIIVAGKSPYFTSPAIRVFNPKGICVNEYFQIERRGRADKSRLPNPSKALALSSPDDRFVALYGCGESNGSIGDGEVGIFEVERDSSGNTLGLKLSFSLAGHVSSVSCLAWNSSGKRLVTCCEDGVWRWWDTSVRYNENEVPRLFSGHQSLPKGVQANHVAVMIDDAISIISDKSLIICRHGNGEIVEQIDNFVSSSVLTSRSSFDGQYLATVVNNCRRVPLWKSWT